MIHVFPLITTSSLIHHFLKLFIYFLQNHSHHRILLSCHAKMKLRTFGTLTKKVIELGNSTPIRVGLILGLFCLDRYSSLSQSHLTSLLLLCFHRFLSILAMIYNSINRTWLTLNSIDMVL